MNLKKWSFSLVVVMSFWLCAFAGAQAASSEVLMQKVVLSKADVAQLEQLVATTSEQLAALQVTDEPAQWAALVGHSTLGAVLGLLSNRIKHAFFKAGFGKELEQSADWLYAATTGAVSGALLASVAYIDSKPIIKSPLLQRNIIKDQLFLAVIGSFMECLTLATKEVLIVGGSSRPLPLELVSRPTRWLKEILFLVIVIERMMSIVGERAELSKQRDDLGLLKTRLEVVLKKVQEENEGPQSEAAKESM